MLVKFVFPFDLCDSARILRTLRDFNVGISNIIYFRHSFFFRFFVVNFLCLSFFSSHISYLVLMFLWKGAIKVYSHMRVCVELMV